jgi:D-lactate dehydrogenase (cytochrome)
MQNAVRRVRFPTKSQPLYRPPNRLFARKYTTVNGSPRQAKRHTALLLAGTAALSTTAGYLLAGRETEKPGSPATDLKNTRYGTLEDFRKAIEELKAIFPEPGAISDDPIVVAPYGFSQNDYHPGGSTPSSQISRVLMHGVF